MAERTEVSRAPGPAFLYLHGFASGPESAKGRAIADHFAGLASGSGGGENGGVAMERLDLRLPSLEHLRLSAMIEHVRARIGGEQDRAVVFGSSLGGLTAARVAEIDPRVCALVLLAPAFRIAERWRARIGEHAFCAWRESGWLEVDDHATKKRARVDFAFVDEAARIDARGGGWPDVRVPTLVIHGAADETVSIDLTREWCAGKRHVRFVEVDDGHELVKSIPLICRESERFLAPFLGLPGA